MRITGIHPRAAVPFFQSRSQAMEVAAVSAGSELNLAGQGNAVRLVGSSVTANFFRCWVRRSGGDGVLKPGGGSGRGGVVILSHALWEDALRG